jgi:hypothetical protein
MSDDLRDLLNRVASGEITPEQAQAHLQGPTPPPGAAPGGPAGSGASAQPVSSLAIRASAVRLIIVGDPAVDSAVAEGPHRMSHDGDTLTVHSDLSAGEFQTGTPRSAFATWLGSVNKAGSTLRVRVNPNLPLEVLNVAGSLELSGVRAPARVGVEAGSAKLHGGAGSLALSVASGSADVEWQFFGDCSVTTDLGSARVSVLPGSDVAIAAEATVGMASIRLADGTTIKASPAGNPPVVVGQGAGRLTVTSRLGSLVVSVP